MISTSPFLVAWLKRRVMRTGKGAGMWRRLGRPSMTEWAEYLRLHGGLRSMGENCAISSETVITDPYLTSLGNNVRIAGAWISGHDGSVNMLNRAYGAAVDAVGPVVIGDDVFVGRSVMIMPNTVIGSRAIVGAGSVVSGTIEGNSVVAGVPARRIRSLDDHFDRIVSRNKDYPWSDMIAQRKGGYDAEMEPVLRAARISHFFPDRDGSEAEGDAAP